MDYLYGISVGIVLIALLGIFVGVVLIYILAHLIQIIEELKAIKAVLKARRSV